MVLLLPCSGLLQMTTWPSWIGLQCPHKIHIKHKHTLWRDRSDEDSAWYNNNHNPQWIPTVWAQKNNPWIRTYITPMMLTRKTEAYRTETTSSHLDLIYNCTVFWPWILCLALLHNTASNLHLHSKEGRQPPLLYQIQYSTGSVFSLRRSSKLNVLLQWTATANKSNTEAWWCFPLSPLSIPWQGICSAF